MIGMLEVAKKDVNETDRQGDRATVTDRGTDTQRQLGDRLRCSGRSC